MWGISQHCCSRVEGPANITWGLNPFHEKCVRLSLPTPTNIPNLSEPWPPPHASPTDVALHLCSATDSNVKNYSSFINIFISLFLSLSLSVISVHSCGLSPQAVMQSSDSCAQSQGLELARRAVQGRHHKKLSWKATGEERRERGDQANNAGETVGACQWWRSGEGGTGLKQTALVYYFPGINTIFVSYVHVDMSNNKDNRVLGGVNHF